MASISLSRLLDLAIGTPEVGAVNFNVLYRLLKAMLKKLDLNDIETDIGDVDRDFMGSGKLLAIADTKEHSSPYHQLEQKVSWVYNQLEQLKALPSTKQLSDQLLEKGDSDDSPLSHMWQYMQLKKKVESNEDGIEKLMSMVSDLMKQIDQLQITNATILKRLGDTDLNLLANKIGELYDSVNMLTDRLDKLPQPEDISSFVTWTGLEDALNGMPRMQPSMTYGKFYGYLDQIIKMTPEERNKFLEDAIKSGIIHQFLPRLDDELLKLDNEKRRKSFDEHIANDTFKQFLPQTGSDLLNMSPEERANFVKDALKWGSLRAFLPRIEKNLEAKDHVDLMNSIEDSINQGDFHKYLECKYENVDQMNDLQKATSITAAIHKGLVDDYLPGINKTLNEMDEKLRNKFIDKAVNTSLVEAYTEVTGNEPPPLSNLKKEVDNIILNECQTLMYTNNGKEETELAKDVIQDTEKEDQTRQPSPSPEHTASPFTPDAPKTPISRPGTGSVGTPRDIISAISIGPSPDLGDILEKLGKLYEQHNKLVKWVNDMNDTVKEKAEDTDLKKLEERVEALENLLRQKIEMSDLGELNDQVVTLLKEIEEIKLIIDGLKNTEPVVVKSSLPNIGELVENRLFDSSAFTEIIERVGGLESKITEFHESMKARDSAYSSDRADTLSFLQDSMSEISSDPDSLEGKRRLRRRKIDKKPLQTEDDEKFTNAEEGSITHDILGIISDEDDTTGMLKRLGLILDDQMSVLREKIGNLDEDLKLMAKGVEVALERVKIAESTEQVRPSSSSSNSPELSSEDVDALRHAQQALQNLQDDVKRLHKTTGDIINANNQKQRQIDTIFKTSEQLSENKADKDYVLGEFDVKADKRQLEAKVNYSLFNKTTDEINKTIREFEVKLEGNEAAMNNIFQQLSDDVDGKIDKMEMDPLKGWVEGRLKDLNKKLAKSQPGWSDENAAGLRKQLIQRFHCLSCDKTINMMSKNPVPSLPMQTSMPSMRSPRPYTVFELDQIRQRASKGIINQNIMNFERALMERQLARIRKSDLRAFLVHYSAELEALGMKRDVALAGSHDASDSYARTRACGGLHTMTFPHRRTIRITNLNKNLDEEPKTQETQQHRRCGEESEVQGADGVIYRGRCAYNEPGHGPKGMKALRKVIPPSASQPLPASPSRPVSARQRSQTRPGSARSGSRPASARPNTVQAIREEDGHKSEDTASKD